MYHVVCVWFIEATARMAFFLFLFWEQFINYLQLSMGYFRDFGEIILEMFAIHILSVVLNIHYNHFTPLP